MENHAVYLRIKPKNIDIIESYYYFTEVSRNPDSRLKQTPAGSIRVDIPYDGELYFTRQAYEDYKRQSKRASVSANVSGRFGSLLFENYKRTDLEYKADLASKYGAYPLEIPLRSQALVSDEDLVADRYLAQLHYDYEPNGLEVIPVKVQVEVSDEDTIQRVQSKTNQETIAEHLAKELATQHGFKPTLVFEFSISLILPSNIGEKLNQTAVKPTLKSMSLQWPFPTSQTHVSLVTAESKVGRDILYDPYNGRLEWGKLEFQRGEKPEGTDAYIFSLPRIRLQVKHPGELYQTAMLVGSLQITLPLLLSGLKVQHFDATGNLDSTGVNQQSDIHLDFELYPEDRFLGKIYAPYQHIQFEGLILDEMRVSDIVKALQDKGFDVQPPKQQPDPTDTNANALKSCTINAHRPEGPNQIYLWLQAEGRVYEVERRRERYGAESFTARVRTGHTIIYMRAELIGSGTRLTRVLNEVQLILKERLSRHIRLD